MAQVETSLNGEFAAWIALAAAGRAIDDRTTVYNTGFNGPGSPNEIMSAADNKTLTAKWEKIANVVIGANTVSMVFRVAMSLGAKMPGATVYDYLCKKNNGSGGTCQGGFNFHIGVQ